MGAHGERGRRAPKGLQGCIAACNPDLGRTPNSAVSTSIPIPGPLKGARFVDRPNRLVIRATLEPEETVVQARLPDPGDHAALLQPDHRVWLRAGPSGAWTCALVQSAEGNLVAFEPDLARTLVHEALDQEKIPELEGWYLERIDVPTGRTRAHFQLSTAAGEKMLVSVFPTTRTERGYAVFPDGPNEHVARQLRELAQVPQRPGWHATAILLAMRNDVRGLVPNEAGCPECADALRAAEHGGVRLLGRRAQLTLAEAMLGLPIPVDLWDLPF